MSHAHYALSDSAIVLVSLWTGPRLWRHGERLPTLAMAAFALAAAVGVVRFGMGLQTELAGLHAAASLVLGLIGIGAWLLRLAYQRGTHPALSVVGLCALAAIGVVMDGAAARLLSAVLLGLAVALGIWRAGRSRLSWWAPAGLATLMLDAMFVRKAPWLSEAAAWHGYHLLVAAALAAIAAGWMRAPIIRQD